MIECIFTIDYELYGNGQGSLETLVYDPAQRLMELFTDWDATFVNFVEVAELETIERGRTDKESSGVRRQIRDMHERGFEIGLHLHPQWCKAIFMDGQWILEFKEYNLAALPTERISLIVKNGIAYLRDVLGEPEFVPFSFRAGNWLLQPSGAVASVLAENGICIDSSVFKGGLQRGLGLDYRPSLANGYYWNFHEDPNVEDPDGVLLEIPVYTTLVPVWQMFTRKRFALQRNSNLAKQKTNGGKHVSRWKRLLDFARFRYPLKLDFCRMTMKELTSSIEGVILDDEQTPNVFKPLVAIGHTKDLHDFNTIERFLAYLKTKGIAVATFRQVYSRCRRPDECSSPA